MKSSTFLLGQRIAVYAAGGLLIAFGLCALISEMLTKHSATAMVCFGYAFSGVMILYGITICVTTRFHYLGGFLTYLGVVMIGVALVFAAIMLDGYIQDNVVLTNGYALAGFVFLLGCYCFVAGHIRHRRKQRELLS
jgi:hypothetical protein